MIVRQEGERFVLIPQTAHADLAGHIMARWVAEDLPRRATRDAVLAATREHDHGWVEADGQPIVDPRTGQPHDFLTAPDALKQTIWPKAIQRLETTRPYVAALIAQHALTINGHHRGAASWDRFFRNIERIRDRLLGSDHGDVSGPMMTLVTDYRYLYLGDFLSLIFCNGWTDSFAERGYGMVLHDHDLRVTPDPFGGGTLDVEVEGRAIPNRVYTSDTDLRIEVARADKVKIVGTVRGRR